jgi:hypothetical protein
VNGYIDPRGKLFGHMDRLAEIRTGKRPPPVNVEVDVSNRCNLGCRGCHFAHLHSWAAAAAISRTCTAAVRSLATCQPIMKRRAT